MDWFRHRYPSKSGLLSAQAAQVWLNRVQGQSGDWLAYPSRDPRTPWATMWQVGDGPLADLKELCAAQEMFLGWSHEAQSARYVLEGVLLPVAGSLSLGQRRGTDRPIIKLEIDAEMSPRDLARWYAKVRDAVRGQHSRSRPLSPKITALVEVRLSRPSGEPWRTTLELWNERYPEWRRDDERRLARDYGRALMAVIGRQPGKEKGSGKR